MLSEHFVIVAAVVAAAVAVVGDVLFVAEYKKPLVMTTAAVDGMKETLSLADVAC